MGVTLVRTDVDWVDVGELVDPTGDFAYGTDENDFSLTVGTPAPPIDSIIYREGSPLGGIVRGVASTGGATVTITGDTWTGVLNRRVIGPDAGQAYLTLTGDVRDIVAALVSRAGLASVFTVAPARTGLSTTHKFDGTRSGEQAGTGRYMGCWTAIWQVCSATACKVTTAWNGEARRVLLTVSRRRDWTDAEAVDGGIAAMSVKVERPANHLVCMGSGELEAREILHLYADERGAVSKTQTIKGPREITQTYDDSAASGTELESHGRKKLAELWADATTVEIACAGELTPDIGDLVGGTDPATGVSATATVTKEVATLARGRISHTYQTTVRR